MLNGVNNTGWEGNCCNGLQLGYNVYSLLTNIYCLVKIRNTVQCTSATVIKASCIEQISLPAKFVLSHCFLM